MKGEYMKSAIKVFKKIWNDESAQGATEYILLLVVVVAVVILFKGKITEILGEKVNTIGADIQAFTK
jgi:Flp pilus assembly pilin Flp